jgi:OOP family OmpA-OmpF porin
MKFTKTSVMLGVAVLAAVAAPAAMGQGTGWYGGANVGRTGVTIDDDRISGGLRAQGLGTTSIDDHDQDRGYKIFGGYQLNRNFAVEAGFFDLGNFGYTARTAPAGSLTGDIRIRGLNLDLVGILPLTDRFSAFGRVGVTSARTEGQFSATGAARVPYANANPSQRATNAKFGAGLMYDFTESLGMRVEAERYRISDAVGNRGHADMVSVGLVYRFGANPQPVRAAAATPAAAPAPIILAVAPAPVVQPAPPPLPAPLVTRVSLSADSVFDFDKSIVKPAGREALDKLAGELRGIRYDSIQVTGHTDRLGSADYNAALSSRRAVAVSDYLVQSGGVPAAKIAAKGQGEANPVTQRGDCKGAAPTQPLIACLQPDRRVEVEVSGTR